MLPFNFSDIFSSTITHWNVATNVLSLYKKCFVLTPCSLPVVSSNSCRPVLGLVETCIMGLVETCIKCVILEWQIDILLAWRWRNMHAWSSKHCDELASSRTMCWHFSMSESIDVSIERFRSSQIWSKMMMIDLLISNDSEYLIQPKWWWNSAISCDCSCIWTTVHLVLLQ